MFITVNQKRETFFTRAKTFMQCGQQEKCQENISGSLLSIFQPGVESDNTSEMFKFKYNKRQLRSNNCKLYLQKPKTDFMKNRFYTEVPQHGTLCPVRLLIILTIVYFQSNSNSQGFAPSLKKYTGHRALTWHTEFIQSKIKLCLSWCGREGGKINSITK